MRTTSRHVTNKDYWDKRWRDVSVDDPMENVRCYPLKEVVASLDTRRGPILEAGCGAGRILRHLARGDGFVVGMDFIHSAVSRLKASDPSLRVLSADITCLPFADNTFGTVYAFGLFHNLQGNPLTRAIEETRRVLRPEGVLHASFRADNPANSLSDRLAARRNRDTTEETAAPRVFHKLNLTKGEVRNLFNSHGLLVNHIEHVVNMPILYKFRIFRHATHKSFDEHLARREGYRLSMPGRILMGLLMLLFPAHACNIHVLRATKSQR